MVISALIATLGAGAIGVGTTFAATGSPRQAGVQNLISAIATKFNLSESDVQAVFDEHRLEKMENHQERREDRREDRLENAVTDGKLTQAQADAIQANIASQNVFIESLKDKTQDEKKAAIKANHESQKAWAEASGIPKEFLPHGKPGQMRRGK